MESMRLSIENRKRFLRLSGDQPRELSGCYRREINILGRLLSQNHQHPALLSTHPSDFSHFVLSEDPFFTGKRDGEENEGAWEVEFD